MAAWRTDLEGAMSTALATITAAPLPAPVVTPIDPATLLEIKASTIRAFATPCAAAIGNESPDDGRDIRDHDDYYDKKNWHPAANLYPLLTTERLKELANDIKRH